MNTIFRAGIAAAVLSALLAACGSDDSSTSSTVSAASSASAASASTSSTAASGAAGVWEGTTSDNRTYAQIVLGSGAYYSFYSAAGDSTSLAGAMMGTGTASGQTFTATDGRAYDVQGGGAQTTALSATFVAKSSLVGTYTWTLNGTSSIVSFSGAYDSAFETTPKLSDLAGSYTGNLGSIAGAVANATVTVAAVDGSVIVNAGSCSGSGKATPRTDGNAYDVTLTFGASPCLLPNQSVTGIGYYRTGSVNRLYITAPTANRSDFFIFAGSKQ